MTCKWKFVQRKLLHSQLYFSFSTYNSNDLCNSLRYVNYIIILGLVCPILVPLSYLCILTDALVLKLQLKSKDIHIEIVKSKVIVRSLYAHLFLSHICIMAYYTCVRFKDLFLGLYYPLSISTNFLFLLQLFFVFCKTTWGSEKAPDLFELSPHLKDQLVFQNF